MESHIDDEVFKPNVDISCATRQVWLVKVPKYLANRLERAQPLQEIGRIRINTKNTESQQILFNISEELAKSNENSEEDKENTEEIPIEHKLHISLVESQTLSLFTHNEKSIKISIEGTVERKGEFRPIVSSNYLNLYKERMRRVTEPLRKTKQLDRTVTVFKAGNHKLLAPKKKVSPIKKFKKDRETVRNMLFELFEKHEFYKIGDLERLTLQPVYYLKEVMREMCIYNIKSPHQYMWQLRPEFRHYSNSKQNC